MFQQEIIKDVIARLKEHQLPTPSKWRGEDRVEDAEQVVAASFPAYCRENARENG